MLREGQRWAHVILHTRCSWLHGDGRGFRSRGHRLHSSGDYRNPPPPGEHAGLRRHHRGRSGPAVVLGPEVRPRVASAAVEKLRDRGCVVLALSVSPSHLHALASLPRSHREADEIIAAVKQRASHAAGREVPKPLWAQGGCVRDVRDYAHHRNVFFYVRDGQERGSSVWTYRDGHFVLGDERSA